MAKTVVMKFGGTSVGSTERINAVARRVASHVRRSGERVVVVVSAMAGETDRLIELFRKVGGDKSRRREYDQLLASGEQVSAALTAAAIEREGLSSCSLLAHQIPIRTKITREHALIDTIDTKELRHLLDSGAVPVVAGFQGVLHDGSFVTLGRGGSDATAVAVAAALGPVPCIIYTDVDGVYTTSPSICRNARKLKFLSYEEMLEMASSGAKVLQTRSVHLAKKFHVPLSVCSSFVDEVGTEIVGAYDGMEDVVVSGITCATDQAKINLRGVPDKPGVLSRIFQVVGDCGVVVDMIVQTKGPRGEAVVSFTVAEDGAQKAYESLQALVSEEMPGVHLDLERNVAKLSVIGEGMRAHAGIASKMFEILGREGINIDMVTTSEIKISVAIKQKYAELAVRSLHEQFIDREL